MTPINPTKYLAGKHRLPAGAVPLATDKPGSVLAVTPHARWIRWWEGTSSVEGVAPGIQVPAVNSLIAALGGTSKSTAAATGISPRTIESLRIARMPMSAKAADQFAHALAETL